MEWCDEGVLLGSKPWAEKHLLLTIFTKNHGLTKGLVQKTKSMSSIQAGTLMHCRWKARLQEHLGVFYIEIDIVPSVRLFSAPSKLLLLRALTDLLAILLPENQTYEKIYHQLYSIFQHIHLPSFQTLQHYVEFEFLLIESLGFGIDFSKFCTLCKKERYLYYISPKSGKGCCVECGKPYADKLLVFDQKFFNEESHIPLQKYKDALNLTGFYLSNYVIKQGGFGKKMPFTREQFIHSFNKLAA